MTHPVSPVPQTPGELAYRQNVWNVLKATGLQATPMEKAELLMFVAVMVLKDLSVPFNGPRMVRKAIADYDALSAHVRQLHAEGKIVMPQLEPEDGAPVL